MKRVIYRDYAQGRLCTARERLRRQQSKVEAAHAEVEDVEQPRDHGSNESTRHDADGRRHRLRAGLRKMAGAEATPKRDFAAAGLGTEGGDVPEGKARANEGLSRRRRGCAQIHRFLRRVPVDRSLKAASSSGVMPSSHAQVVRGDARVGVAPLATLGTLGF